MSTPVQRPTYRVLLAPPSDLPEDALAEPRQLEAAGVWGDQLRAELEAPRHGIRDAEQQPLHFVTVAAWAALARTHQIDCPFPEFQARVINLQVDRTDVDPTQPAAPAGS